MFLVCPPPSQSPFSKCKDPVGHGRGWKDGIESHHFLSSRQMLPPIENSLQLFSDQLSNLRTHPAPSVNADGENWDGWMGQEEIPA